MAAARWKQVAVHVRDDPLVGWGWHPPRPAANRLPARPDRHYLCAIEAWMSAGAPCPSD